MPKTKKITRRKIKNKSKAKKPAQTQSFAGLLQTVIFLLAVVFLAIEGISYYNDHKNVASSKSLSIQAQKISTPTPSPTPTLTEALPATPSLLSDVVRKGDSYWRIAKRNCGSGKYFLILRELNGEKPLFEGDTVSVSCGL